MMKLFRKITAGFLCVIMVMMVVTSCSVFAKKGTPVKIKIGNKTFKAVFYNNDTANELLKKMPLKFKMSELNGNEKYKYLKDDLPVNEKKVKKIKAGDIMLYGSDCLVLFYKSFKTNYRYTKVGRITNIKGLKKAVGKGRVTVKFSGSPTAQPATSPHISMPAAPTASPMETPAATPMASPTETPAEKQLTLSIGDKKVKVDWIESASVDALKELVKTQSLTIQMSMYGGFEQVGQIGTSLPKNDEQTTTSSGDIVLYSGNQIVIFYGSNSWAYTRLGHITDRNETEMAELLGNGDVNITIGME